MKVKPGRSQKDFYFRLTAWVVLLTFSALQIAWAQGPLTPQTEPEKDPSTEKSVDEASPHFSPNAQVPFGGTSIDFLGEESPLSPVDIEEEVKEAEETEEEEKQVAEKEEAERQEAEKERKLDYEYERYDFEEALDLLRPEFASAVIVKALTEENLKALLDLPLEVGILVLHGEIILFTSGSEEEIATLPAVKSLIGQAVFISHTHPGVHAEEGPSEGDLAEAVKTPRIEYVLTQKGAYAYSHDGLLNSGKPYDYEGYLSRLAEALGIQGEPGNQVEARRELNTFIAEQDRYNSSSEEDRVLFRQGITWKPPVVTYWDPKTKKKIKTWERRGYEGEKLKKRQLKTYDSKGKITQNLDETYYTNGKVQISDDRRYLSGVLVKRTYKTFDTKGRLTRFLTETFHPGGKVETSDDILYTSGIKTGRHRNEYDASGSRQSYLRETTHSGGQTKTSDEYLYSNNKLQKRTLKEFDTAGNQIVSEFTDYTLPLLTNQTSYTVSYAVDGTPHTETLSVGAGTLREGTNWYQKTVTGYSNIQVLVEIQITLDTIPPEIIITSAPTLTNQTTALIQYTVDGLAKEKTVNLAAEGDNTIEIKETDTAGNESKKTVTVTTDWTPPILTLLSQALTNQAKYVLRYEISDAHDGSQVRTEEEVTLSEGENSFTRSATDEAGNAIETTFTVKLDTLLPLGSIDINSGALYASSPTVDLNLSASDSGSGIDRMSFSTNNSTWDTPVAYATTKTFPLPAGDGTKTVYVKYYDKAGNVSMVSSKSIILDTAAPTGSITLNEGDEFTNSETLTVALSLTQEDAGSGASQIRIKLGDSNFTDQDWEELPDGGLSEKTLELLDQDGTQTVYYQIQDRMGRVSQVYFDSITLDRSRPEGSIQIQAHQSDTEGRYATSRTVTLTLTDDDETSGVARRRFRILYPDEEKGEEEGWSDWEEVTEETSRTPEIELLSEDGRQIVEYQLEDRAGNRQSFTDEIILDLEAPNSSILINEGAALTNESAVQLTLESRDKGSGVAWMEFSNDGLAWFKEAYRNVTDWILEAGDGLKQVFVRFWDRVGRVSQSFFDTITLDTVPPEIVVTEAPVLTKEKSITVKYSVDGTAKEKTWEEAGLIEGENSLEIVEEDEAGNVSTKTVTVTTDWTPPSLTLLSPSLTNHPTYVLRYEVSDARDGIQKKTKPVSLKPGANEFEVIETDQADNQITQTFAIVLEPKPPEIVFLSPSAAATPNYTLRYLVDGVERTETWLLGSGENRLIVREKDQFGKEFQSVYPVTWEATSLHRPVFREAPGRLLTVTTQEGFLIHYQGSEVWSIDSPGRYTLTDPLFDSAGHLTGGLLRLPEGSELYYEEGKVVWRLDPQQNTYTYNPDGSLREVVGPDGRRSVFSYRLDSEKGEARETLVSSPGNTSFYDAAGRLRLTLKANGDRVRYDGGILNSVERKGTGNVLHYGRTDDPETGEVTVSVTASEAFLQEYPSSVRYDREARILQVIESDGTQIHFKDGLPSEKIEFIQGEVRKTGYQYEANSLEDLIGLQISGPQLKRSFDRQGKLIQLETAGVELKISGNLVESLTFLEANEGGFPSGTIVRYEERDSFKRALVNYPEPDARKLTYELEEGGGRYALREIQLPEGTVQRFRPDGSLESLKTQDGRIYEYETAPEGERSFLKKWQLEDGRTLYFERERSEAPPQLSRVEFPDGRRIENITLDSEGRIERADERVPERGGAPTYVDHYESGQFAKRSFPDASELLFNTDGSLHSYRDFRGETYQVREERGPQNERIGFRLEGPEETVVYSREGSLTRYTRGGVSFEFDRAGKIARVKTVFGEIQNPIWNETQELSGGVVRLADGSQYFLEDGKIARILRPDGLEMTYAGDRAVRLVKEGETLLLEYITESAGSLKGAIVKYEKEGRLASDGLINFLIRPERAGKAGEVFDAPLENLLTSLESRTSVAALHRVPLALGVVERGSAPGGGWWFDVIFDSVEVSEGLVPTLSLAPNPFLSRLNLGYQVADSASLLLNDLMYFGIAGNFALNGGRVPIGAATIGSRKGFPLNYEVSSPGSSVGFYVSYDLDWTEGIETRDFTGLGEVVLGTQGEPGTVLTLELTDRENRRSRIFVRGIDSTERFFNLNFSLFQEIDLAHIKSVTYILEGDRQLVKSGTLDLQWSSPFTALSPESGLDSTKGVELPAFQQLHLVPKKYPAYPQDVSDKFTIIRSSDSEMEFHYEGASDYWSASAAFDYDLPTTKDMVEYKDLSSFSGLVLGSERGSEGTNYFSIQDAHGNRARVRLYGNAGSPNFYFLDLDKLGIDLRRVRSLAFTYYDPKVEDGRVWLRGIPREGPVPFPAINPDTDELAILANETVTVAVNPSELAQSDYLNVSLRPPHGAIDSKAVLTLGEAVYRTETLSDDWNHLVIPLAQFSGAQADSLQIAFEGSAREGNYLIDNLVLMRFQDNSAKTLLSKLGVTVESLSRGVGSTLLDLETRFASFVSVFAERNETPSSIHAELGTWTGVVTEIDYDSEGRIKEVRTGDGRTLVMAEEGPQEALLSQGVTVDYGYGQGNEPQSLTITSSQGNQASLSASYQYGRIREVRRPDGSRLQYGYEFTDGVEVTVVKTPLGTEPETYEIKRYLRDPGNPYQIGQLLSVEEPTGLLTVYEYAAGSGGPEAPLKRSRTYYKGRVLSEFSYEYQEGRTLVTDQEGTVTEYDSEGRLISHTTSEGYRYEHLIEDENFRVLDGRNYLNGKLIRLEAEGFTIEEGVVDSEGLLTEALLLYPDGHRTFFVKGAPFLTTRDVGEATFFDPAKDGENPAFQNELSHFRLAQALWKAAPKSPPEEILPEKVEVVRLHSRKTDEVSAEYREGRLKDLRFKEDGMEVTGLSYDRDGELDGAQIKLADGTGFVFQEGLHVIRSRSNEVMERLTPWNSSEAYQNESERWVRLKMQAATFVRNPDETARSKKTDLGMALYDEWGRILEIHLRAEGVLLRDLEFDDRGRLVRAKVFSGEEETTEYREGLILSYQGGDGKPGEAKSLFDEGNFHYESARSQWKIWKEKISEFLLDPAFVIETELDSEGTILTLTKANQSVSLYEKGKIDQIFDQEGRLLITNQYDPLGGMLVSITMVDARRRLEEDTFEARRDLRRQKVLALEKLAHDTELAFQAVRDQFEGPRKILLAQRANVESLLANLEATKVRGKQGKREKSGALDQIRGALQQIDTALSELDRQYAEAIESLSQKAAEVASQIETESNRAFDKLQKTRADYLAEILRQEVTPVLHDLYRNALGRDPGEEEVREAIHDKEAGIFNPLTLRARLLGSGEYQARLDEVNRIRREIRNTLALYLAGRYSATENLGLSEKEVISLTSEEIDQILQWLDAHDLHFGHSAFLALESLLQDEGKNVTLWELATRAILIDIFSGVVGPFEEGELKLSLFALERTARYYGVTLYPAEVSYEELRQMVLGGKKVIVHLKGDHYTVITGLETITETRVVFHDGRPVEIQVSVEKVKTLERNKGAAGEEVILTKKQFLDAWLQGEGEKGFVLSSVPVNPQGTGKPLSPEKAQSVRGAFFFFIPFIISVLVSVIQAVIAVVIAVVAAVVAAVSAAISAVVGAISNLVTTLGRGLSYLAKGFQTVGKFLFEGVRGAGKLLLKGLQFVGSRLYQGFQAVGSFLKETALKLGGRLWQGMEKIGTKLAQGFTKIFSKEGLTKLFSVKGGATSLKTSFLKNALGYGLNFPLSKGLDSLGIDFPGLNLLTSFVTGGVAGLTGSASSTSFFTSVLQKLTLTGLSTLALHLDLPPPIANVISVVGSTLLGATLDPSLTIPEALKDLVPTLARDLAFQGILSVGKSIGLDPRLAALIGLPVMASVGGLINGLGSGKGIFDSIKGALQAGAKSIGLNVGGANSLLKSITSTSLLSAIGTSITSGDIFQQFFGLAKDIVLSPFKLLGNLASTIQSFGSVIQEKGLGGALESLATSIFGRQTIETIFSSGGIGGFLDDVRLDTVLPTGTQAKELKIGSVASLFFDLAGELIGIREGDAYRIGTFGLDSFGKFGLLAGKIITTILGNVFEGDILNGTIQNFRTTIDGVVIEGEGDDDGTWIPGPGPEPGGLGALFSGIIKIAGGLIAYVFKSGLLTQIFTEKEAEASTIPIPEPIIDVAATLLKALEIAKSLSREQVEDFKNRFDWLVHYTSASGLTSILAENLIRNPNTPTGGDVFFAKAVPFTDDPSNITAGARLEIARRLQIFSTDPITGEKRINPLKATHFVVIDAEELNADKKRPVEFRPEIRDVDGNPQVPFIPMDSEYVFNRGVDITGKIIWPPLGSPALQLGYNSLSNWVLAQGAIIKYFLEKHQP